MISAKVISAQHPKNARTVIRKKKKKVELTRGGGLGVFLVHQITNPYTGLWDLTIVFYVWYNQNEVQSLWSMNLKFSSIIFYLEMYDQHIPMGYN
jgi:hypothetical protein